LTTLNDTAYNATRSQQRNTDKQPNSPTNIQTRTLHTPTENTHAIEIAIS